MLKYERINQDKEGYGTLKKGKKKIICLRKNHIRRRIDVWKKVDTKSKVFSDDQGWWILEDYDIAIPIFTLFE